MAASTEGYRARRDAVDNIWDTTGIILVPEGRDSAYVFQVGRYSHGAAVRL